MKKLILFFTVSFLIRNVLHAQNVGIGTTNPVDKLSVVSGVGYGITHEAIGIKLGTYIDVNGGWIGTQSNNPFHFFTANGLAQMSLLTNGNVGIGKDNPLSKLHIFKGSAGGVSPQTESHLTLENNNHLYMTLLTPDNRENGILFGLNSSNVHGGIIYNNPSAASGLLFRTNGNVNRMVIDQGGNVGIGLTSPTAKFNVNGNVLIGSGSPATGYMLSINGKMICTEAKVQLVSGWPDYVFKKDYKLLPLDELEKFIKTKNHLPNIPAAAEIEKNGMELGDMVKRLMEKVEELTLYVIELEKRIKSENSREKN